MRNNNVNNTYVIDNIDKTQYKTLSFYENNEFRKDIFRELGINSKKVYNTYIYAFQIYSIYKNEIFKQLYDNILLDQNIDCDLFITNKFCEFFDNYCLIKDKIKSNNRIIYSEIKEYLKLHKITVKTSNYNILKDHLIFGLKTQDSIYIDGINDTVLVDNIISNILTSIYNKNYNIVKQNMINHKPFNKNTDKDIIEEIKNKNNNIFFTDNDKLNDDIIDISNDIKNNNINQTKYNNYYKTLIASEFKDITGITSDQNIISKVTRIKINDIRHKLESTMICNIMNKAHQNINSFFKLKQKGIKANMPKFLKDKYFNLIYTYLNQNETEDGVKFLTSKYMSNNFNALFPNYTKLDKSRYVLNDYMLKYKVKNRKYYLKNKEISKKNYYFVDDMCIKKKSRHVYDARYIEFKVIDKIKEYDKKEVEVVFLNNDIIKICIKYANKPIEPIKNITVTSDDCISIDLGLKNLLTIFDPTGTQKIIRGGYITSINQHYKKLISEAQSNNDISKLYKYQKKRTDAINNYFNLLVKWLKNNYSHKKMIILGYNEGWKTSINLGRSTNYRFMNIPYRSLIDKIKLKFEEMNIKVRLQEESYTSKCDSLSKERICKHEEYKGSRINRGLYSSSTRKLLNADINGAINIMRKILDVNGLSIRNIFNPVKVNIFCEV